MPSHQHPLGASYLSSLGAPMLSHSISRHLQSSSSNPLSSSMPPAYPVNTAAAQANNQSFAARFHQFQNNLYTPAVQVSFTAFKKYAVNSSKIGYYFAEK